MRYFIFQAAGSSAMAGDCTTNMPDNCFYTILASGIYQGKFTNLMECVGELGSWPTDNTGKVTEITSEEVPIWESNINPPSTQITKLEFRNLFTLPELIAIETASETDAILRVLDKNTQAASWIDLADPTVKAGLDYLVSKTLITSERETAILSNTLPIN